MTTYFLSDPHYGHINIAGPNVSNWDSGYRWFDSINEMNSYIVDAINSTVTKKDTLILGGDLAFSRKLMEEFIGKIHTSHIWVLVGNHDAGIIFKRLNHYRTCGLFERVEGLFYEKILGHWTYMTHCASQHWWNMRRGSFHVHGHNHNTNPRPGRILDFGIESLVEKFGKPIISDQELVDYMINLPILNEDHHDN